MKTISMTYCKRFDNSCYHLQCIANWTAVILLQVRMASQEESAVKNEKHEGLFRYGHRTVGRTSSIGGLYICAGGLSVRARGAWHSNLTKIPLIHTVSYFNLRGLEALFEGLSPPKPPPVATGLYGQSGGKALWIMRNTKGCFGSDVVTSHMTQLVTGRWWWRVASWLRHEALLQVKNA